MPLGHQLTPVAKVEATCTAPGAEAYWKCTRDGCGKLFSDADGKNETSLEALTIPALGHDWATELTKGDDSHYYACSRCDERKDEAAHTGGTATCTEKAVCEICGQEYGAPLDHDWATAWTQGDTTHYYACSRCTERKDEAPHSYSWTYVDDNTCKGECTCGATTTEAHYDRWASFCDYQPHCEKCDHDYGPKNEHSMYYVDKGESGHKPYCYNCDTYFFVESHSGGEATCTSKAKCEKCGAEYGGYGEHTGGKATCTEKAKCTVCGQPYGDVDPNNHDLIHHEQNGLLYPCDDKESFLKCFRTLREDGGMRAAFGRQVMDDIEVCSLEVVEPQILDLYRI
jgi:hypothetical protein